MITHYFEKNVISYYLHFINKSGLDSMTDKIEVARTEFIQIRFYTYIKGELKELMKAGQLEEFIQNSGLTEIQFHKFLYFLSSSYS